MIHITVGTTSQYKIDAVSDAAGRVFPGQDIEIIAVDVYSYVSDQPMSNEEAIEGARNRARAALGDADYAIGIENGISEIDDFWFANTWVVAVGAEGGQGIASTLLRPVPSRIMSDVLCDMELSGAVRANVLAEVREQYSGLIGIITNGVLNRHDVLRDGIIVALSDLILPDIY